MSEAGLVDLAVALISFVSAVTLALVGARIAQANADRRWARERRVEAYLDFLRRCDDMQVQANLLYGRVNPDLATEQEIVTLHRTLSPFLRAADRVEFFQRAEISGPAGELEDYCRHRWEKLMYGPKPSEKEWLAESTDYTRLRFNFREAATEEFREQTEPGRWHQLRARLPRMPAGPRISRRAPR